jgi:hypothetical protein
MPDDLSTSATIGRIPSRIPAPKDARSPFIADIRRETETFALEVIEKLQKVVARDVRHAVLAFDPPYSAVTDARASGKLVRAYAQHRFARSDLAACEQ